MTAPRHLRRRWLAAVTSAAVLVLAPAVGIGPAPAADALTGAPMELTFVATAGQQAYLRFGKALTDTETVDVIVDWGDGSAVEEVTEVGIIYHTYTDAATYTVTVSPRPVGDGGSADGPWLTLFGEGRGSSYTLSVTGALSGYAKLTAVRSFGDLGITSLSNAFTGHAHITDLPNSIPSTVTDLGFMFKSSTAALTDADVGAWDVGSVTNMRSTFEDATSFDAPIGSWDVSNVTTMVAMFSGATAFDQDLSSWVTGSVTDMGVMFLGAESFDAPIGGWDVSSVTSMASMFDGATAFDQDLSRWDVSSVTDFGGMFAGATSFDRSLGDWVLNPSGDEEDFLDGMLDGSGMSSSCYDATLVGWAALDPAVTAYELGASGLTYSPVGAVARGTLTVDRSWSISGDSAVDVATGGCAESAPVAASTSALALACLPTPVVAGGDVTCTVSGGDPDVEILWTAGGAVPFASRGVRLGPDGTGTFTFTAPRTSLGDEVDVELVSWGVVTSVVVGGPVPSAIPAGGGAAGPIPTSRSAWPLLLAVVAAAVGAVVAVGGRPGRRWRRGVVRA